MGNKVLKHAVSWLLRAFVYIILGPFAYLHNIVLRCKLAYEITKLRGKEDFENEKSTIRKRRGSKMMELIKIPNSDKLDFKLNRARAYIDQLTFGNLREISRFASGHQRVRLVSNHVLHHVLFNSVFSYELVKEDDLLSDVGWRLPFTELSGYESARDSNWDVAEILILKSGRLNIRDRAGYIHTPQSKTWPLAKAHVQAQLTFFAPGLAHNHVHYVLPTLIASEVRKLSNTSVLRQLLEPHCRFTQYVNYRTLHECISSSKPQQFTDRLLRPWLKSRVEKEAFTFGVEKKCEKFYFEDGSLTPTMDDEIAYQSFLKEYYVIFWSFVDALSPLLKNDYDTLRTAISEHAPGVAGSNMVDVLAGFLWNSSVVHYCDRESYLQQWARRYGCMSVRIPLVKLEKKSNQINIKTVSDGKVNGAYVPEYFSTTQKKLEGECVIDICRYSPTDGSKYFRPIDVCRTRCYLRTFVQFNQTQDLDMNLFKTKYDFTDPIATAAVQNFFTNLRDLNSFMRQRGEAIVNGENFTRSVCF